MNGIVFFEVGESGDVGLVENVLITIPPPDGDEGGDIVVLLEGVDILFWRTLLIMQLAGDKFAIKDTQGLLK